MNNESKSKTLLVAALLCVVCAVIVSSSSVALKGMQQRNKELDEKLNILRASGEIQLSEKVSPEKANELFAKSKTFIVNLETGEFEEGTTIEDKSTKSLDKSVDVAGIKKIQNSAKVYAFGDESGALKSIVLPIEGTGLWSKLYGFLSLNSDLNSVAHIVFYEHGETPGLGGEISNPNWTSKWEGKSAFNEKGEPVVRVIKGTVNPESPEAKYEIDGISGATLTGNGVTNTVDFWLGANGYGPFLTKLRATGVHFDAAKEN